MQTVVALVMPTADFAAFISTYPAVLKIVENQIFTRLREAGTVRSRRWARHWPGGDLVTPVRPSGLTGQNCTVVRTDVVAFGAAGRDDEAHKIIRKALVAMTQLALGPVWDTVPVRGPRRRPAGHRVTGVFRPRRSSSGW